MRHDGCVQLPNNTNSAFSLSLQNNRIDKRQRITRGLETQASANAAIVDGNNVEVNGTTVNFETNDQADLYASLVDSVQRTGVLVAGLTIEPMLGGIDREEDREKQKEHFKLILTEGYDSENLNYFNESYIEKLDNLLTTIKLASTNCIAMLSKISEHGDLAKRLEEQHITVLNTFRTFLVNNELIDGNTDAINEALLMRININIETRQGQILQIDEEISDITQDETIKNSVGTVVFLQFVNVFMKVFQEKFKSMKEFYEFYKKHKSTIVKKVDKDKLDDKNSFSKIVSLMDDSKIKKQMQTTVAAYYAGKTITGNLNLEKTNGDPKKVDDLVQTLKDRHEAELQIDRVNSLANSVVSVPGAISDIGKDLKSLTHLNDQKNEEKNALGKYYEDMISKNLVSMGYEESPHDSGRYKKNIGGIIDEVDVKEEVQKRLENFEGGVNKGRIIAKKISSLASSTNKIVNTVANYYDVNNNAEEFNKASFASKTLGTVSNLASLTKSAIGASSLKKNRSELQNLASNAYKKIKVVDGAVFLGFRIGQIVKTSPGDLVPVLPREQRGGLSDDSISNKKMSRIQAVQELKNNDAYYRHLKVYSRNIRLLKQAESLEIRLDTIHNRRKRAIVKSVSKSADLVFGLGGLSKYANKNFPSLGNSSYGKFMNDKVNPGVQAVPNFWATTVQEQISRIGGSVLCLVSNIMAYSQKKKEEESGIKEGAAFGKIIRTFIETEIPKEDEIYKGYDFVKNEFVNPMDWKFMRKMRDVAHLFEDTKASLGNTLMNKLVISAANYKGINEDEDFKEDDDDLDKLSGKEKRENELVNMVRILHMQVSSKI